MNHKTHSEWKLKVPPYVKKTDARYKKYSKQLKTWGFCDAETWSLYSGIAKFTLPRLIKFKEKNNGFPMGMTSEEWDKILDKMIFAFEWIVTSDDVEIDLPTAQADINWKECDTGLRLFGEHFRNLWW